LPVGHSQTSRFLKRALYHAHPDIDQSAYTDE